MIGRLLRAGRLLGGLARALTHPTPDDRGGPATVARVAQAPNV